MNKNLIKSYALKLEPKNVIDYAFKEGVKVTLDEATLFVDTVKEKIDDILDGKGPEIIESIKNNITTPAYEKLVELFNKYKKFID